jgi:hypothetical protein
MDLTNAAQKRGKEVWADLHREGIVFGQPPDDMLAIHILLSPTKGGPLKEGGMLSISFTKITEWVDPDTKVMELAIIPRGGLPTAYPELGYLEDIRLFDGIEAVVDEIHRVKAALAAFAPSPEPEP